MTAATSEAYETAQLAVHPVAEIFPMMSDRELASLVEDVRHHGLREPIWLHRDGRIIDGRNRYLVCQQIGLTPETRIYAGNDADLVQFVVSLNLHRRHLNESQRAMVAARIANMRQGERTDLEPSANLPKVSQSESAQMLAVSDRSVRDAKKVQEHGAPEVVALVDAGQIAVSAAALVADEVKDQVRGLGSEEVQTVVRKAVTRKKQARTPKAKEKDTTDVTAAVKRNRRPMLDAVKDAAFNALRAAEAIERLRHDDRWKTNAPKIDPLTRDNLRRALELLEATVASIPVAETE